MTTNPVLSIVTPLYNRGWCIADCIASIGLGDLPAELIIVDDGSKDDSLEQARNAVRKLGITERLTLIEQQNAGPSVARNRAAEAAQGEWLVFLDSDDLWFPWTLSTLCDVLSRTPEDVDLAFLGARNFGDVKELAGINPEPVATQAYSCFVEAVKGNPTSRYGACNAAIRRAVFAALGGFEPELRCAEDSDLFLRVQGKVLLVTSPILAALRRSGHESLTGNANEVIKGFRWMLRQDQAGRYVGAGDARRSFLARSCAYSTRVAFATGYPRQAYSLYLQNLRLLGDACTRKYISRLPLTPLLHLYKPAAYPFRVRPVGR